HAHRGELGREDLLEARGGVGAQPQRRGGASHRNAVEVRGFDDDVARRLVYGGGHPALHSCDAHHPLPCRYDEHRVVERVGLLVERLHLLAVFRRAHAYVEAAELSRIEGVERLAYVEHDEVRRVHHVIYRALAHGFEARAQPLGARADLDTLEVRGDVAAAQRRGKGDLDLRRLFGEITRIVERVVLLIEREFENGGELPGDAAVAEAIVPAVGRHLHVEHVIDRDILDAVYFKRVE